MKRLLSALVAIFALALGALAQSPTVYTVLTGGTNVIAANTTNTPGNTFSVSEYASVDVQVTLKASTTNTTAVVFYFAKSLDSTTYETTPSLSCSITPNGTAEVSKVFNLSVPNVASLKLSHAENANANGYVTNVAVKYRLKAAKVLSR